MNHPIYLRQLKSEIVFKISDRLKAFNIQTLVPKKIIARQYLCKKNLKVNALNKKVQLFNLTTIEDEAFTFFEFSQAGKVKPSVFTLGEKQFFQGKMLSHIVGQVNQKNEQTYQITGFKWDGFIIQFVCFSEDTFLLIITNQMVSSILRKNFTTKDLQQKIKQSFEQIVGRIINQKKSYQLIENYVEQLRKLFQKHRELVAQVSEENEVNFNLIKYGKISEISTQEINLKAKNDKQQTSPMKMDVQK